MPGCPGTQEISLPPECWIRGLYHQSGSDMLGFLRCKQKAGLKDIRASALEYVGIGGGACNSLHARTSCLLVPSRVPAVKMSLAIVTYH